MMGIGRRRFLLGASSLVLYTAAKQLHAGGRTVAGDVTTDHKRFLGEAVRLAQENRRRGGRPFGAVLTLGSEVVATGVNNIVGTHDVTAHAEMEALRAACRRLERSNLKGTVVYASGHPCPMCLAAMVIAKVDEVYYAFGNDEAEPYGFSSAPIYEALHLQLPTSLPLTRLDVGVTAGQVYGPEP